MATKIDKLFALKAVEQKVTEERKLLEGECRDELLEAFANDGTDRRTSKYFGTGAGKFSIKRYKAEPEHEVVDFALADDVLFAEWIEENQDAIVSYIKRHPIEFATEHFSITGECADGITRVTHMEPGRPECVSAKIYSFKPDVVLAKLGGGGNVLEEANRLLLSDGE